MGTKDKAFVLYNLVKKEIYDPELFTKFEHHYKLLPTEHLTARHCFGALWAYMQGNQGSRYGLDFWTSELENKIEGMHAQEVHELLQAFRNNRSIERSYMIDLLETKFKAVLLKRWRKEV